MATCHECVICLESSFRASNGVSCPNDHFICHSDLSSYLTENVLNQVFKLRKSKGRITCPVDNCQSSLNCLLVFATLFKRERARYVSILHQIIHEQSSVIRLHDALLGVLTLKCPKCKTAVDPLPDACSAVMCLNCGIYYCNHCFVGFDCGDTARDRAQCHEHVAEHKETDEAGHRDAFLSEQSVKEGQKKHQCAQLRRCLLLAMTSRSYGTDGHHDVCLALVLCFEDLELLDIDVMQLWHDAQQTLLQSVGDSSSVGHQLAELPNVLQQASTLVTATNSNNDPDDDTDGASKNDIPGLSTAQQGANNGGRQLANALRSQNSVAAVQILQSFGAELDPNHIDAQSGFPLTSLATLMGLDDSAAQLIRMGADMFGSDRAGRSVLYVLIESGNKGLLELALDMNPALSLNTPITSEKPLYMPIHVAVKNNNGHLVRLLLQHGASLDTEEQECRHKPLALALLMGCEWAASELIRSGADFSSIPEGGRSPVYLAIEKGQCAMLELMRSHGPFDVNQKVSRSGMLTMLHTACAYDQTAVVSYLLGLGADVDSLSDYGDTPLFTALQHANEDAGLMLIRAGADVSIPSSTGTLPIHVAVERGMHEVVEQLLTVCNVNVNAPTSTAAAAGDFRPLHLAQLHKQHKLIPLLFRLGADVNAVESHRGLTPLLLAAVLKDELGVALLAPHRPDPLVFSKQGRNCIFAAAEIGSNSMLHLLITKCGVGVDAEVELTTQHTALHIACIFDQPHTVHYLLRQGADAGAVSARGKTPLDCAREASSFAAEAALLEFEQQRQKSDCSAGSRESETVE